MQQKSCHLLLLPPALASQQSNPLLDLFLVQTYTVVTAPTLSILPAPVCQCSNQSLTAVSVQDPDHRIPLAHASVPQTCKSGPSWPSHADDVIQQPTPSLPTLAPSAKHFNTHIALLILVTFRTVSSNPMQAQSPRGQQNANPFLSSPWHQKQGRGQAGISPKNRMGNTEAL